MDRPEASTVAIRRYAEAEVPTTSGRLRLIVYRLEPREAGPPVASGDPRLDDARTAPQEHMAIVAGEPAGDATLARVHSECWTGEVMGSLKCDCRAQLDTALRAISDAGRGVVVYLRQEGRGIGLGNKIRAYALQNQGADTVEANEALGFAADLRSYELAAAILRDLGVASVALMTNNPAKVAGLERAGVRVVRRVPHWVEGSSEESRGYLAVKRLKLGHRE